MKLILAFLVMSVCVVAVFSGTVKLKMKHINGSLGKQVDLTTDITNENEDNILWYRLPSYERIGSGKSYSVENSTCADQKYYQAVLLTRFGVKRQKVMLMLNGCGMIGMKDMNMSSNSSMGGNLGGGLRNSSNFLNTSETDNKWYRYQNNTREVFLYLRRVDEEHPYFSCARLRIHLNMTYSCLRDLFSQLEGVLGVSDIIRVVKNDLELIENEQDVMQLKDKDRLEVFYEGAGAPTRMKTAMASAEFVQNAAATMIQMKYQNKGLKNKDKKDKKPKGRKDDFAPDGAIVTPDWPEMYPASAEGEMETEITEPEEKGRKKGKRADGRKRVAESKSADESFFI